MRCASCEFENLPGLTACARCGSGLLPQQVVVEPPRASRLRARTHLACWTHDAGGIVWRVKRSIAGVRFSPDGSPRRVAVIATLIPGLGHLLEGLRFMGGLILFTWLALLLLVITDYYPGLSHWLIAGMIMVHNLAFISLLYGQLGIESFARRVLFSAAVFGALFLVLYAPAMWCASRCIFQIPYDGAVLGWGIESGDTLLLGGFSLPPATCRPGELVVYRVNARRTYGAYVRQGYNVDRILAGPGDRLTVENGTLIINGAPAPPDVRPLGPIPLRLRDLDLALGEHEYAVLPSNIPLAVYGGREDLLPMLRHICKVPRENIRGRVLWRVRPFSRFGPVE